MSCPAITNLDHGWADIKSKGVDRLEYYLEHDEVPPRLEGNECECSPPIHNALFNRNEYSFLYSTVYNMCVQRTPFNFSEQLYKRYRETIQTYCVQHVKPKLDAEIGDQLLRVLFTKWTKHQIYVRWMKRIFNYLDRYYVKMNDENPVESEGYHIFHDVIFREIMGKTTAAMLDLIRRERGGEAIDRDLMKGISAIYHDLELCKYEIDLEEPFLKETKEHYQALASGWRERDNFPEYMIKVENAIAAENDLCVCYLHRNTASRAETVVVQVLLEAPIRFLLEKETAIEFLLESEKREDLHRTYLLFSKVPTGLQQMANHFREFVKEKGISLVQAREAQLAASTNTRQESSDPSFIQKIIDLHDNFRDVSLECFMNHFVLHKALKEAFEVFLNRDVGKLSFSQLMASFCDKILRKSGEKLNDEQIESLLQKVVELFGYISDKDLFAEIYRTMLAKRLLYDTSSSRDMERSMIQQLKLKCGAAFTSKLEGMVNDLTVAVDTQRKFAEFLKNHVDGREATANVEFQVQVLTTGMWPSYPQSDFNLCPEMRLCLNTFQEFYTSDNDNASKRLTWIPVLGSAVVQAKFTRKYDLMCNTHQACLLLMFNDSKTLSVPVLRDALNLDESLLKKYLGSFFMTKNVILKRIQKGVKAAKGVGPDDEFEVNTSFSSAARKIKIPIPVQEESFSRERVEEDRTHAIQASVVRIMKMRRELKHNILVSEVIAQLHNFQPSPKLIKQEIEKLIEREFLERDETDTGTYRYVA